MPDSKITALTSISTSTDPANDPLVIVDLSDTSMAATGTTKKVTLNQLLGASGTATLASATISGDLTVDTNVLKVDTSNNRVGVTTASPFCAFHTNNDGVASGAGWTAIGRFNNVANTKGLDLGYNPSNNNAVITALSGGATSGFEFWSFDGSWSNRMTLNATGLGVGGSPTEKLSVNGSLGLQNGGTQRWHISATSGSDLIFTRSTVATRFTITSDGNVGIGVTPSAWSGVTALQISRGSFAADTGSYTLSQNVYNNGGNKYIASAAALQFQAIPGTGFLWYTAPSGTAGNAITFTQAMTLDASGRLILLASTTTPATLATNGELTFTATSNTNLRFSYRGSDGVTRTADLTLA